MLASADGGLSWRDLPAPAGASSLSQLSCSAWTSCVAVGSLGAPGSLGTQSQSVVFWTDDGGRSWARAAMPLLPDGRPSAMQLSGAQVACSADSCTAVLSTRTFLAPSEYSFLVSSDHGRTWSLDRSPRALGQVAANADIEALTCNGAGVCAAVGDSGGAVFYSHDGGRSWATAQGSGGGPPWA